MKYIAVVLALMTSGLLAGCRSDINKVRNGYLESNRTTTIGQALEHTFSNGKWKSYTTEKGVTIVEFDGFEPFKEASGYSGSTIMEDCSDRVACIALTQKIEADCNSASDMSSYKTMSDELNAQIAATDPQTKNISNTTDFSFQEAINNSQKSENELLTKRAQLQRQLNDLKDPRPACIYNSHLAHANDPIPVAVQFSMNQDGTTFQYQANDLGLGLESFLEKIYK